MNWVLFLSRADISQSLWEGVSQNEDDLSYMFDETTPVKACGDLAYHVADGGSFILYSSSVLSFTGL